MDNTQNLEALKAATIGAQQIQAPDSPLGASNYAAIAGHNQAAFQLPQSSGATNASANIAQQQVEAQKAAAAAAKAAANDAQQKAQDLQDINKYRIVQKDDGGYDFFDPTGAQVDIATLSQRTGTKPVQVLKNSENPIDQQYVQDYGNLQNYVQAVVSGDRKTVDSYQAAEPNLKQYNDKGGVQKLIDQFKQTYQRYYTPRSVNAQAWGYPNGNTVVPTPLSATDAALYGSSGGIGN